MAATARKAKFGRAIEALLWIAALAVLVENIALSRENRRLLDDAAPDINTGAQLQMAAGVTLDGRLQPVELPPAGSKLLVLTFSPGCPACQANQSGWAKLASEARERGIRVLWVSRDPVSVTRDYCLKNGIPIADTLADPPYQTYLQLGLARVPNTVLVRSDGTVEKVWAGRLDQAGWDGVFADVRGQAIPSPARTAAGNLASGCGPESARIAGQGCK